MTGVQTCALPILSGATTGLAVFPAAAAPGAKSGPKGPRPDTKPRGEGLLWGVSARLGPWGSEPAWEYGDSARGQSFQ